MRELAAAPWLLGHSCSAECLSQGVLLLKRRVHVRLPVLIRLELVRRVSKRAALIDVSLAVIVVLRVRCLDSSLRVHLLGHVLFASSGDTFCLFDLEVLAWLHVSILLTEAFVLFIDVGYEILCHLTGHVVFFKVLAGNTQVKWLTAFLLVGSFFEPGAFATQSQLHHFLHLSV